MDLAALIISTLALVFSISSLAWQLGKHWSTHAVQLVPAEQLLNPGAPAMGRKIGEEFKEFDELSLDDAEQAYFEKHNKKKTGNS